MPLSNQSTYSPTLLITSTSQQQRQMTEGFVDRFIYKLMFKPLDLNSFQNVTDYVVKKVLCHPFVYMNTTNHLYLDQNVANEGFAEIMKKMGRNVSVKGKENYQENSNLMKTLKLAIRDGTVLSKGYLQKIKNSANDQKPVQVPKNLWYFK